MKLNEVLEEGLIDKFRAALGTVKGKIVSSLSSLLLTLKRFPGAKLTTVETFKILEKDIVCRVDTGALWCSIHAEDVIIEGDKVSFTHDGSHHIAPLVGRRSVKNANGHAERVLVKIDYQWKKEVYRGVETTLANRSKMNFKALIGRNLIKELKLPVYISDKEKE